MVKTVLVLAILLITIGYIHGGKMTKEEAVEAMKTLVKKCAEQSGATEEDLKTIMKKVVPESKAGKCFVGCTYKEIGIIRNGKYSAEGLAQASSQMFDEGSPEMEKIKNIGQDCEGKLGGISDECELGAKAMECEVPQLKAAGIN